jgi:hypothetical protein
VDLTAFSDLVLPDAAGEHYKLRELWRDQPVVVVFLRHFG